MMTIAIFRPDALVAPFFIDIYRIDRLVLKYIEILLDLILLDVWPIKDKRARVETLVIRQMMNLSSDWLIKNVFFFFIFVIGIP